MFRHFQLTAVPIFLNVYWLPLWKVFTFAFWKLHEISISFYYSLSPPLPVLGSLISSLCDPLSLCHPSQIQTSSIPIPTFFKYPTFFAVESSLPFYAPKPPYPSFLYFSLQLIHFYWFDSILPVALAHISLDSADLCVVYEVYSSINQHSIRRHTV